MNLLSNLVLSSLLISSCVACGGEKPINESSNVIIIYTDKERNENQRQGVWARYVQIAQKTGKSSGVCAKRTKDTNYSRVELNQAWLPSGRLATLNSLCSLNQVNPGAKISIWIFK